MMKHQGNKRRQSSRRQERMSGNGSPSDLFIKQDEETTSRQKTYIKTFSGVDDPTEEELKSNSFLDLPLDFFDDDDYIDESIPTIGVLGEWVTDFALPTLRFQDIINLLADRGYIEPSLGNRRLLASILSGRKLNTHLTKVKWIEKQSRTKNQTEKVMLWLCKFLFNGHYAKAYEIFGIERTIKKGQESSYAETADLELQREISLDFEKPRRKPNKQ